MSFSTLATTTSPSSPRVEPAMPDTRIGTVLARRYLVRGVLGQGGMGTVYLAEDRFLNREVALKMVRVDHADDAAEQQRLQTESERLGRLSSPRVVSVYDLLVLPDGQRCAVLELIKGVSLESLLKQRRLSALEATQIAAEVCRALRDMHDHRLLHLDVKPGNILLGRNGIVKLTDFGLALPMSARHVADPGRNSGTLPYMPPEQLTGDLLYPPSDLYGLGVLYFEMLTGQHPIRAGSPQQYLRAHVRGDVLEAVRTHPAVPSECRPFLRRALAFRVWERFVKPQVMLEELRRLRKCLGAGAARAGC